MYFILGVYKGEFEDKGDFPDLPEWIGLFFVVFGNSIGDFRIPSYDNKNTSATTKSLIFFIYFCNMFLSNIVLLNFVIALISQVYEQVMNSQIMFIYIQRKELNNEWYRFNSIMSGFKCWKE